MRRIDVLMWASAMFGLVAIGAAGAERSVWDGVYTEAQSKRGERTYAEVCASCHAPELTGSDVVPALVGDTFLTNWNGLTAGDLFERIRTSMPQEQPGSLTNQQYADVVAFIFNSNKFPASQDDLTGDLDRLALIRIESKKPF